MALARRLIIAGIVVFLSAIPCLPSFRGPTADDWGAAGPGWARGPVWYIMTNAEYSAYRRLRSDADRRGFIRSFWSQRDPLPETPDNELEREFWRRVTVADGHFGQDIKPGWKTERGKFFIMLGPPENLERDRVLADQYGASRWVYDLGSMPLQLRLVLQESLGIPSDRRIVNIKVREEPEGARAVGSAVALQSSVLRPTDFLPLAETLVRRMPGPDALRNLGHVMRVPEVLDRLSSRVSVSTVFSVVPVQARIDFRPSAASQQPDRTTVAVTLGVAWRDLERIGVTSFDPAGAILNGYLTSVEDENRTYRLTGTFEGDPGEIPGADRDAITHVFQAVQRVPPGRYLLDVAYQDTNERIMGSVRDVVDVPAFSAQGLAVSSLVLSSRLEKLEGAPAADAPFRVGPYRVVPRTTQVYHPPADLTVFYEVYGAARGEDGLPRLAISYQFYLQDAGGWIAVGAPMSPAPRAFSVPSQEETETSQAWSVPLGCWPPGRYRLEVSVTDRLTDSTVVRGALFEIAPPAP